MTELKKFIAWACSTEAPEWVVFVVFAAGFFVFLTYFMSVVVLLINGFVLLAGLMVLLPLFFGLRAAIVRYKSKGQTND